MHLRQGETVAVEGGIVDRCFMIEYGSVEVRFSISVVFLLWVFQQASLKRRL